MNKGKLYIVATPIGNLDDITLRAINTLNTVDLIIAEDTRHSLILLKHFNITKPLESYHKFNENSKSINLIEKLKQGTNIALISDAGTPGISDPGQIIISLCINNEIDIIPIPGACAFIQALISSGFSTNKFSFYGFLPLENKERKETLNKIATSNINTIILYEAPHKLIKTLNDLLTTLGDINICISKEITKLHELHFRTTISKALTYYTENPPKGEFVIILEKPSVLATQYLVTNSLTQNIIIKYYLDYKDTLTLKEISQSLSSQLNISKNDIYNYIIEYKKKA